MVKWVIGKTHIDREVQDIYKEKLPLKTNPAKDGIFDFPLFHVRDRNSGLGKFLYS